MNEKVREIIWATFNSLISAVIITIFFAIWNDNQGYNMTGTWNAEKTIEKSSIKREEKLVVGYYIFMTEFQQKMIMNAEKRYEILDENKTVYNVRDRIQLKCKGEKVFNFFSANKIIFNCIEKGKLRESITILDLTVKSEDELLGTFTSSAADEVGSIHLYKN